MSIKNTSRNCNIGRLRIIFRKSFVIVAVVFWFNGTSAFNLDYSASVPYIGPKNSSFGFAVTGYIDDNNKSSVLVGAPTENVLYKSTYTEGAVYICDVDKSAECQRAKFPAADDDRTQQWLGATLTTTGSKGVVMACAPRYYWVQNPDYSDPVGFCYYTKKGSLNFSEFYTPCRIAKREEMTYVNLGSCQAGFSGAISENSNRLYVGAVGSYNWKGSVFAKNAQGLPSANNISKSYSQYTESSYIGYSMTSLNFFGAGKSGIAVGIPRMLTVSGQVAIFTEDLKQVKILGGPKYPDYFGYSMCTADVDGDGAEDLIIGAPMHTDTNNEYEKGRIYIYYQGNSTCKAFDSKCEEKIFAKYNTIDGVKSRARFGSAVASLGDINKDGFEDIAVSAPYERSKESNRCAEVTPTGAVYIYLGSKDGLSNTHSQVIRASDVSHLSRTAPLSAFGFSLSGRLDLDKNQYPDLVVGAYESDAVFLFKSRPVINLNVNFSFLIKTTKHGKVIPLARNQCTQENDESHVCVSLEICLQYNGVGVEDRIEISTNITLDAKNPGAPRMRFLENDTSILKTSFTLHKSTKHCDRKIVYVDNTNPNIDKVTPLEAVLTYALVEPKNRTSFSGILNFGSKIRTDSFNISRNCGEDEICYPNLNLTIIPDLAQYEPISNVERIHLQVLVKNNGEDSYGSKLLLRLPGGLEYYDYMNAPQTDKDAIPINPNSENITFSIGNPLLENQIVNFTIILSINKDFENLGSAYHFWAEVNSTDREIKDTLRDNEVSFEIPIIETVHLLINSASAPPSSYNHSRYRSGILENDTQAGPKAIHQYSIKNSGTANLAEITAVFFWPITLTNGGDLLYLMQQPRTEGPIQCDHVPNVNYKNLTKIRSYKNLFNLTNSGKPFSIANPGEKGSTIRSNSKDTPSNRISINGADYQKIRCTISNLTKDQEVSVLFPGVVWMETIKRIAGLRNKSIEIGSYVEVNVIKLSRNVTRIPENTYEGEAITTIQLIKSLPPDVIPLWIVVGSSFLGVLILMLMIYGLYKLGFFKRNRPPTFLATENYNVDDFESDEN